MSDLKVRRLGYALGAEITGLDLRERLDDETIAEIRGLWLEHVVLCIPGQNLTGDQMMAFSGRFGELHAHVNPSERHPDFPPITMIVNNPIAVNGKSYVGSINDEWHTDQSFTIQPPTLSFLNAEELPDLGGNTLFANQYMAYEALSHAMRAMIDPIEAVFDTSISLVFKRSTPATQAAVRKRNPPVVHPLVRVHPETGRKALYIGTRLRNFVGMTEEETRPLRDYLLDHATRYEFSYRHTWTNHDLIMWDNRCALHRAVTDYDLSKLRRMIRCEINGTERGRLAEPEAVPA